MNRRDFLKILALGLAQLTLMPTVLAANAASREQNWKVLVIGAGMTGLTAASRLKAEGAEVIVLEARPRLGGRIWTDDSLGLPLDMGAAWIHGSTDNPLTQLAESLSVQTVPTDMQAGALYDLDGRRLSAEQTAKLIGLSEDFYERLEALKHKRPDDFRTLAEAVAFLRKQFKLPDLEQRGLDWLLNSSLQSEYASSASDLGWAGWNEESGFDGPDLIFPKGYHQLIKGLAKGLDIRLNHSISAIEYSDSGVSVQTNQGVFRADQAVITLPLGVLKERQIRFSPELPKAKQKAISRLEMGTMNKIALRFPKAFWPEDSYWLAYLESNNTLSLEIWNMIPYVKTPVLVALTREPHARLLELIPEREAIASAMTDYRKMFGSNIPDPIAGKVTHWNTDPFARGSYSRIPPGATLEDIDALAESVGDVLFFAGEATHVDYPSTVHGAYLSGRRAAREMLEGD